MDWNQEIATIRESRRQRPRLGHGERPAIVIIDFQRAFTQHAGCGEHTLRAIEATASLLETARSTGTPVIHVALVVDDLSDRMLAQRLRPSLTASCLRGNELSELHPLVQKQEGDHYVEKSVASAFHRTELDVLLARLGVDEVVLCGTSISGCVRATAMDAAYRSLRVSLVEECCDDFRPVSREASLWDVADRFGDVVTLAEMTEHLLQRAAVSAA